MWNKCMEKVNYKTKVYVSVAIGAIMYILLMKNFAINTVSYLLVLGFLFVVNFAFLIKVKSFMKRKKEFYRRMQTELNLSETEVVEKIQKIKEENLQNWWFTKKENLDFVERKLKGLG